MAGSAQPHKSMSFIWIVWSTLYVYLWAQPKIGRLRVVLLLFFSIIRIKGMWRVFQPISKNCPNQKSEINSTSEWWKQHTGKRYSGLLSHFWRQTFQTPQKILLFVILSQWFKCYYSTQSKWAQHNLWLNSLPKVTLDNKFLIRNSS